MTGYVGYAIQKVVKNQYKTETDSSIYGLYSNVGYFWKWKISCMAQQLMLISISVPITISQSIDNMGYHMKIEHHRNMRLCVYVRACNFSINVQQPFLSCVFFYFFLFILFYVFYLLCASLGRLNLFFAAKNNNNVRFTFIWGFKNIDDFVLFPFQTKYFVLFSGLCARVCCCFFLYCNSTLLQQI